MLIVESTDDPVHTLEVADRLFQVEPERSNMVASALVPGTPRRSLVLFENDSPVGAAVEWDRGYTFTPLIVSSECRAEACSLLAEALPDDTPRIMALGADALDIAGAWSERVGGGFSPASIFRIYAVTNPVMPSCAEGVVRIVPDAPEHLAREVSWAIAFGADTGLTIEGEQAEAIVRRAIDDERLVAWEVGGEIVARLMISVERCGVVRIGGVYTPPAHRGRGHAAALTAAVSERLLLRPSVRSVILNTQAENPMTNRLYRRLGYRSIGEFCNLDLRSA